MIPPSCVIRRVGPTQKHPLRVRLMDLAGISGCQLMQRVTCYRNSLPTRFLHGGVLGEHAPPYMPLASATIEIDCKRFDVLLLRPTPPSPFPSGVTGPDLRLGFCICHHRAASGWHRWQIGFSLSVKVRCCCVPLAAAIRHVQASDLRQSPRPHCQHYSSGFRA